MRHVLLGLSFLLMGCGFGGSFRDDAVPISAQEIDLPSYMGLWHEIARYPNRFEEGCSSVTAEYALEEDGSVAVTNSCQRGGVLDVAQGQARVVGPGEFKVRFSIFQPVAGDYWVLYASPSYDLAVVGAPSGRFGWILAREPVLSEEELVVPLAVLRRFGYDTDALIFAEKG